MVGKKRKSRIEKINRKTKLNRSTSKRFICVKENYSK